MRIRARALPRIKISCGQNERRKTEHRRQRRGAPRSACAHTVTPGHGKNSESASMQPTETPWISGYPDEYGCAHLSMSRVVGLTTADGYAALAKASRMLGSRNLADWDRPTRIVKKAIRDSGFGELVPTYLHTCMLCGQSSSASYVAGMYIDQWQEQAAQ